MGRANGLVAYGEPGDQKCRRPPMMKFNSGACDRQTVAINRILRGNEQVLRYEQQV